MGYYCLPYKEDQISFVGEVFWLGTKNHNTFMVVPLMAPLSSHLSGLLLDPRPCVPQMPGLLEFLAVPFQNLWGMQELCLQQSAEVRSLNLIPTSTWEISVAIPQIKNFPMT
jgi:hypothetical protein